MILLSCEHAANLVPRPYEKIFQHHFSILHSHRGWDPGALAIAEGLAVHLDAHLYAYPYTRLLIEPNRSLHHPKLFSEVTKHLPPTEKQVLIETYYQPYRRQLEQTIAKELANGPVWHFSIHTFTPELKGQVRNADIGLLYDPISSLEKAMCKSLKTSLKEHSTFRIRMNYPYCGKADGLTTYLRKVFHENYAGIEIEINQALATTEADETATLLANAIRHLVS